MSDKINKMEPNFEAEDLVFGIVMSRFNGDVVNQLLEACLDELHKLGVSVANITLVTVPGALEIPLALKIFAAEGHFDALIALGAVIRGETYHFELVANESGRGISQISLDYGIPVVNAVLTTENEEQALARTEEKGREAAKVAIEMANLVIGREFV